MVKIRLRRGGHKNGLYFRIVAVDERKKNSGAFLEELGFYNPSKKTSFLNKEKYDAWIKKGAVASSKVKEIWKTS